VIQRAGDRINPPFYGRYIAEHIPGARYFEQPGDHVLRLGEGEELETLLAEIDDFLASAIRPPETTRALTTIMLAKGTIQSSDLALIHTDGGVLRTQTPDRVLATFDAPGRAIRCALALRDKASTRGAGLRVGIHTGEVDLVGDQITGPSLSIAGGVSSHAQDGEILVSRTVKDLVVGSGITFTDRGWHMLTATGERWALFSVCVP
jgi:class 3 adenylate cyclase